MSRLRAILHTLRIDKLFTMDIVELAGFYIIIAFHIIMLAFIVWLFKWFLYVSC